MKIWQNKAGQYQHRMQSDVWVDIKIQTSSIRILPFF